MTATNLCEDIERFPYCAARLMDGVWKMAFRKVLPVNSDGGPPALGFLVQKTLGKPW